MRPEAVSYRLLGVTRSKAKMYEFDVPLEHHIKIVQDPAKLFPLSIGLLGDFAAQSMHEEPIEDSDDQQRETLSFSAQFFDAYLQSKLNTNLDAYVLLLGSASYYLCNFPGSARVLARHIGEDCPDLEGESLEDLVFWLLYGDLTYHFENLEGSFGRQVSRLTEDLRAFFKTGAGKEGLHDLATTLVGAAYESGTPRQLLLADVADALIDKKIENSSWVAIPRYSGLPVNAWREALEKETFIKELWPAQHLLGQANVLRGQSAVVQMPTSAGKTKATEIVVRSAFLSQRASLAVIVAPFRALCHEIKNSLAAAFEGESTQVDELSDTFQTDFEIAELLGHNQVLVITPEKLLYVLRHAPELASHVGLVIFDEGHQFDSGARGITYELLLTFLRRILPENTQVLLISAVISNAAAVGDWLTGEANVVSGANLNPTFRSIAFASWLDRLGRVEFVDTDDTSEENFFVPRVIESMPLKKKGRERKDRVFPDKSSKQNIGKEVAMYLGLKLAKQGSIAVFCGRKDTASGLLSMAAERFSRELQMEEPRSYADQDELSRLVHLISNNLGPHAPATKGAELGIFGHHGNTPHGIRLAVEHGMREGLIRFVVCTSTLAQGVNLPIRYLIVTSVYQGAERIKVRDFHNLIGRAGRAGMHTEGSVLFADPVVFDNRKSRSDRWRWVMVQELLDPENAEPCVSNLLSVFDPLVSDNESRHIAMDALDFAQAYIDDPDSLSNLADAISQQHRGFSKDNVERQISWRINLITSVESFLMSHMGPESSFSEEDAVLLAEGTLAYFLADDARKDNVRELFRLLARHVLSSVPDPTYSRVFGRTLYGVRDSLDIEAWLQDHFDGLLAAEDGGYLLQVVWPMLRKYIGNSVFRKLDNPDILPELAVLWTEGRPFHELLSVIEDNDVKLIWGTQRRNVKIDQVVDLCESGFSYDGSLLVGAIAELSELLAEEGEADSLVEELHVLQKQLKYGLPNRATISLYELGFADRVIAMDLAESMQLVNEPRNRVASAIRRNGDELVDVLNEYPQYFQERLTQF